MENYLPSSNVVIVVTVMSIIYTMINFLIQDIKD
jgi:preprotein translocase subunit SecE